MKSREQPYLELPTQELLEAFGAGNHIPGSGSAAALTTLVAVELLITVTKITIGKPQYQLDRDLFEILAIQLVKFESEGVRIFYDDTACFDLVSKLRRKRDACRIDSREYKRYIRLENKQMKEATIIPLKLCDLNLRILRNVAFVIFDKGFKSAQGDSGTAISNLLSSISSSLFIIFLNLKKDKRNKWNQEKQKEALAVGREFRSFQKQTYTRIFSMFQGTTLEEVKSMASLYETLELPQIQLELEL